MYAHEELPPIDDAVERLAYVTIVMDDDMHSAHSMKQLYSSTVVWADKFTPIIQQILKAGFDIISNIPLLLFYFLNSTFWIYFLLELFFFKMKY